VIENQTLKELGYTGGKRGWTIGSWRVGRFTRFVYGNTGGRFPAGKKGVRILRPVEDAAPMSRRLNVMVRPPPSYERWIEMMRQLSRGVRPSGHPQSTGS